MDSQSISLLLMLLKLLGCLWDIEITRRTTRAVPEILKEWRGIFEKTTACITSGAMTTKMLEAEADDPWFKRHFALYGHIDSALQLENAPPEEEGTSIPQADVQHQPQPQEESPTQSEGLQDFVDEITSNTRTIATGLLRISTLVENAPSAILENDRFKKMFESARKLVGFKAQ
nr:uncharacterized protein LOC109191529 [Ipomoea batatas]GME17665.1 uncharacterized protein LOC109191529 [Ipomoea batatas]